MEDRKKLRWPGWEIRERIGTGGFGAVYEITREVFGDVERKALKIITIPKDSGEIEYMRCEGLDDESITNSLHARVGDILREYKLMTKLRENPNIVHCDDFDYVQHEHDLGWDIYIKMELLTPLLKALDKVRTEEEIIRLGVELCNALVACQRINIIHRDIKPQNIFLSPEGHYKLGDFGIARRMEHTTKATAGIGTYSFMAPEVILGKNYGSTVDIYSLGLVIYWLLNERRGPFVPLPPAVPTYDESEKARIRRWTGEPIPAPRHGSEELKAVVLKACAFDPKERYQTAREMMDALKGIGQTPAAKENAPVPAPAVAVPEEEEYTGEKTLLCPVKLAAPAEEQTTVDPVKYAAPVPAEEKTVVEPIKAPAPVPAEEKTVAEPVRTPVRETTAPVRNSSPARPAPRKSKRWIAVLAAVLAVAVLGAWAFVRRPSGGWEDNVLMAEPHTKFFGIQKEDIISVTFLDTLSDAPFAARDVSYGKNRRVLAWTVQNGDYYDMYIAGEGGVNAEKVTADLFSGYRSVQKIDFNGCFHTENAINMEQMFYGCWKLEELDLSGWDTSSVTDMSGMFKDCTQLTTLDLSGWDTSNVMRMGSMFERCFELASLDLSGWKIAKVTYIHKMFTNCTRLTSLDLSGWDTSGVTDMGHLFFGCGQLTSLDLSDWDISNVDWMYQMFNGCVRLTTLNLAGWSEANKAKLIEETGFSSFTEVAGNWRKNVLMAEPHKNFSGIQKEDIISVTFLDTLSDAPADAWDVSDDGSRKVLAWALKNGDKYDLYIAGEGGINAAKATEWLFWDYTSVKEIKFNGCFYTEDAVSLYGMFDDCRELKELDLSSFDTSNVASMGNMFSGCAQLTTLDLSGWDTSNLTSMGSMFERCFKLASLDLSGWKIDKVMYINGMFNNCAQLTSLDLSGWDTAGVTDMRDLFSGCGQLTSLDLSGWDISNVDWMDRMFNGCVRLTSLDLTGWSEANKAKLRELTGITIPG